MRENILQDRNENSIPAVSVIMPVYNGECTLEESLRSVINQTLQDWELIVVDDGSIDGTAAILHAFEQKEFRITVVKTSRTGPAPARNAGLKQARGRYVFFMDADDWIPPESLAMMLKKLLQCQAQVAVFGFCQVEENGKTEYRYPDAFIKDKCQLAGRLPELYRSGVLNPAWNKLYDKNLLIQKGIFFPDLLYGEDRMFVFDVLEAAERIVVDHRCCYEYRAQGESLVTRYLPEKFEICGKLDQRVRELAGYCGEIGEQGRSHFSYMYIKSVLSCISVLFSSSCPLTVPEKYQRVREMKTHPYVRAQLCHTKGNGALFSFLCLILRTRPVWPSMLLGWGISFAQRRLSRLFLRAKH
jgi:glycosyltransferase involved in cell wall biosynthesis